MAKTTKKTTTKTAVEKKAAPASIKEEVKKIASKPEAKKIAVGKEPEKITTTKAPEKITAKPEPKKIAAKETVKIETKVVEETKAAKVKSVKAVKKVPVKKEALKSEPAKKAVKKIAPVKEEKKAVAPVKKAIAKKAPAKKADKSSENEKYVAYTLEQCIAAMQAMGVMHTYEDYKAILMDEADLTKVEKNIVDGNALAVRKFDFKKDGYDLGLVSVTLHRVEDSLDIKASDYPVIKKDMNDAVKTKMTKDDEKNAKEYLKEFKIAEKILMIGQRKNFTASEDVSTLLGSDVDKFMKHFFDLAYEILPTWQFDDVKFYEDFAYAILSQYADLYDKYQLEILIECADLYIKHGDFQRGDESYGYILRDNQIKDYIYYRFASIYEDIDINKAKGLAYESLQYVDDRFTYYPNIVEILNK